jgi:hypothetical protein
MRLQAPVRAEPAVSAKHRILVVNSLDDRYGSTYRLRAFVDFLNSDGLEVDYVATESGALSKLKHALCAAFGSYDLLLTQKFNPITLMTALVAKFRGKPVVVDWDDLDVGLQRHAINRWIARICEWAGPHWVTKITTHSRRIQEIAERKGLHADLIEQGFRADLCRRSESTRKKVREKFGFRSSDFVVGHICTLTHGGTLDLKHILNSWGRVADSSVRFLLIGGGPMEPIVRRWLQDANLTTRVQVTGLLPQKEAIECLNGIDLGIVFMTDRPGNRERVSFKALEYLAMNVPISGQLVGESDRLFGRYLHRTTLDLLPDTISELAKRKERSDTAPDTSNEVSMYEWSAILPRLHEVIRTCL